MAPPPVALAGCRPGQRRGRNQLLGEVLAVDRQAILATPERRLRLSRPLGHLGRIPDEQVLAVGVEERRHIGVQRGILRLPASGLEDGPIVGIVLVAQPEHAVRPGALLGPRLVTSSWEMTELT
jgi:hypothetical protein